jgi:hypothetical protein
VARSKPSKTAVCVVRVEARGETGMLITVMTTPDVLATSAGHVQKVAGINEALSVVARFLRAFRPDGAYDDGS